MVAYEYIIYPIISIFALTLAILAVLAYNKTKKNKNLALAGFFLLFLIKGSIISVNLFFDIYSTYWLLLIGGIMDAFALGLLYIMTLKE